MQQRLQREKPPNKSTVFLFGGFLFSHSHGFKWNSCLADCESPPSVSAIAFCKTIDRRSAISSRHAKRLAEQVFDHSKAGLGGRAKNLTDFGQPA